MFFSIEATYWVSTTETEGMRLGELVPEFFESQHGFAFPVRPQQSSHFSQYSDDGRSPWVRLLGRAMWPPIKSAKRDHSGNPSTVIFDERLRRVQGDIASLACNTNNVEAPLLRDVVQGLPGETGLR